jgi:hypothetical protein
VLNAERAREEVRLGMSGKKAKPGPKREGADGGQGALF